MSLGIGGEDEPSWQEELMLARWGTKLNALLPAGWTLAHFRGAHMLCPPDPGEGDNDPNADPHANCIDCYNLIGETDSSQEHFAKLFSVVARATGATPQKANAALSTPTRLYFVQVASSRTKAFANALTERLQQQERDDELKWMTDNFYEAGGFPGPGQSPIRMMPVTIDGVQFHRVVVGTFATPAEARDYQAEVVASGTPATITFRDVD